MVILWRDRMGEDMHAQTHCYAEYFETKGFQIYVGTYMKITALFSGSPCRIQSLSSIEMNPHTQNMG